MSKVIGPLLSLDASKTFGKILTFQNSPSGTRVYKYNKPGDIKPFTPSLDQNMQRAKIRFLVAQWQALTSEEKASFNDLAEQSGYLGTGYHYYIHNSSVVYTFIFLPVVLNTGGTLDLAGVSVSSDCIFSGYAWSTDVGWIAFGTVDNTSGPVSIILTPGPTFGHVTGKAKVLNTGGFLDFDGNNSNVVFDFITRVFSGYVFSDDVGWIDFTSVSM